MATSLAASAVNALTTTSTMTVDQQLQLCEKSLLVVDNVLDRHHIHRMILNQIAYECCVKSQRYVDAVRYGREALNIRRQYEGDWGAIDHQLSLAIVCINAKSMNADAHQLLLPIRDYLQMIYGEKSDASIVAYVLRLIALSERLNVS